MPKFPMKPGPNADRLKELLDYDPATGVFTWKVRASQRRPIGSVAGCLHPLGYVGICVDKISYQAHRLAWLYVYGEWPSELDHINRIKSDNRIANLRKTTPSLNQRNKNARGFQRSGRRFSVTMCGDNRRTIYLGTFDTAEEARSVYLAESARRLAQGYRDLELIQQKGGR